MESNYNEPATETVDLGKLNITAAKLCQRCLLCDNTRELHYGASNVPSWVCDECRDAMTFIKEFIASIQPNTDIGGMISSEENVHLL